MAVETERAANLERDVRVILKKDWYILDREVPCRVYAIQRHGSTTTFRVAFHLDLGRGERRRVGIYYDHPNASTPAYETGLEVTGAGPADPR